MNTVLLHKYGEVNQLSFGFVADATTRPGEVLVKLIGASLNPVDYKFVVVGCR